MPDEFGIRICRTIVRPVPLSNEGKVSLVVNVGSIVDAWWHDGWWEGIVMKKKMENKLHVYLPGVIHWRGLYQNNFTLFMLPFFFPARSFLFRNGFSSPIVLNGF